MTAAWVRALPEGYLEGAFGVSVVQAARARVAAGAVLSVSTADHGDVVLARVGGDGPGGRGAAHVTLRRTSGPADGDSWEEGCTCEIGSGCEHVVATLLHLRGERVQPPPVRSWRQVLAPIAHDADDESTTPLGVHLVVHEVPSATGELPRRTVVLRPVRRSRIGTWLGAADWGAMRDQQGMLLSAAHRRLLDDMVRLERHSAWAGYGSRTVVRLDDLGADGWRWLRRAVAAGVEVRPDPERPVAVSFAEVEAVLVIRAVGAGLRCRVVLTDEAVTGHDGGAVESPDGELEHTPVAVLGNPPHSVLVHGEAGALTLRPLAPGGVAALDLIGVGEVEVPPVDVAEFLRTALPRLRRSVPVQVAPEVSALGPAVPRLVLTVSPEPTGAGPAVLLEWGIRYAVRQPAPGEITDVRGAEAVAVDRRSPVLPLQIPFADQGRDRRAEAALLGGIPLLSAIPGTREVRGIDGGLLRVPAPRQRLTGRAAFDFVTEVLPRLVHEPRLEVRRHGILPRFEQAERLDVQLRAGLGGQHDWFELAVTVQVGDEEVPVARLIEALRAGESTLVLDSGVWVRLDDPALDRLRRLLDEAQQVTDRPGSPWRANRHQVDWFTEVEALGLPIAADAAWARQSRALLGVDLGLAPPVPDGLQADLRPYQVTGYAWLCTLWDAGLGGILADDMGLGKTLQTLAMLERARAAGELTPQRPVLVVAPTSVLSTWVSEARRFAPDLRVTALTRTSRARRTSADAARAGAEVIVTSYAIARLDAAELAGVPWRALVLDEAHLVKNPRSRTHAALQSLPRESTFCITGTPVENNLIDLWAQLALAAPGLFPALAAFGSEYRRPIEAGDDRALARLRRRIRPLILRRTKSQVALDLPPKTVAVLPVPLTAGHQRIYDRQLQRERQRVLGLLEDPEANRVEILASLTRLRLCALDAALVAAPSTQGGDRAIADVTTADVTTADVTTADGTAIVTTADVGCAKLDLLVEQLSELAAEGHRALVFSQFTRFLGRARDRLTAAGVSTCYLDGSTTHRDEVVREFREGSAAAFLISLKAGGVGLTLTEADYVYVLDPWWNPAAEAQAIDRAHRIGQDKPVMVYRLVSAGTIEERVLALQDAKRALADRVIDDDPFTGGLTAGDIAGLLDG